MQGGGARGTRTGTARIACLVVHFSLFSQLIDMYLECTDCHRAPGATALWTAPLKALTSAKQLRPHRKDSD